MSLTQVLAQKPLFKEGVLLNFKDTEIEVRHGKSLLNRHMNRRQLNCYSFCKEEECL